MDNEQLLEQFEELHGKFRELDSRQLYRSAMRVVVTAKRFAKAHRLLVPYLRCCSNISDCALVLFEPEIGIDNAMEVIALAESEEDARKFQHDYNDGEDRYTINSCSIVAYYHLAYCTGMQNGFNAAVVHGAVDDGIHVCRRIGMPEFSKLFQEFATQAAFASGDYETVEHYARLCATSTSEEAGDRRYNGFAGLAEAYKLQGKFGASFEALRGTRQMIETFFDPPFARILLSLQVELLCLLSGRETELSEMLKDMGYSDGMPSLPSKEENPYIHSFRTINDAIRKVIHGEYAEVESILVAEERFLLVNNYLAAWFGIREQRIYSRLLAAESGDNSFTDTDRLADELRSRASKACQWSAIRSLDAMLNRTVRLNPLGIAFPIDIGPYATEGTPISHAQIQLTLPLIEKAPPEPKKAEAEKEKSPLELEIASWTAALETLWTEAGTHEAEHPDTPFPQAEQLATMEQEVFDKILQLTTDGLTEIEFLDASNLLNRLRLLVGDSAKITESWTWVKRMVAMFPDRGIPLTALAFHGFWHRSRATNANIEPASLGLPEPAELERWIADAFEKEPNRVGVAITAGMIFHAHGNKREAQRYFSRATQIDRSDEYATVTLAQLYEEAERPKDALATIELYTRAGGRHPGLLWQATQIAFRNEMPQEFLAYYSAYTELQPSYPMLDAQRIGMLCRTDQWTEALKGLDALDNALETPGRDRLFVRALCQAELGDEAWLATIDHALSHTEGEAEGLVGSAFDPSETLWNHLRTDTGERRERFEQFLFERNLVPNDFFEPDEQNSEGEDLPERGLYRCHLKQPLTPEVPTYAGWVRIPSEDVAYIAVWFVVADTPEEATTLALAAQARCYPLAAESVECEQINSYVSKYPQALVQGKRFPENTESIDSGEE